MDTEKIVRDRKQRWIDFTDLRRPSRNLFIVHCEEGVPPRPDFWPTNANARIEWAWGSYLRQLEKLSWLHDDRVPCLNGLNAFTGTEIFAEAFGCQVVRRAGQMPFALPLIRNATEVAGLRVTDWSSTNLAVLFEIADKLRERAGTAAVLKLPDIQSTMDIAALVWEKESFFMAMIDEPEAVRELSVKVHELVVSFLDAWFARFGSELIAHWPDYYLPRGITLSEDEIGSVSSDAFLDFFLPELVSLSRRYGGIGIHCCASARHQWQNLKQVPDLRLLNLDPSANEVWNAYREFADVSAQWSVWYETGVPSWRLVDRLPPGTRAVIEATASTRDEACKLADLLRVACETRASK